MAEKILAVEDDQDLLELLSYNLENAGYRVVTAADGLSALNSAREQLPDLIILDLMLPDIDGFEICRQVRKKSDIPVLMLTARREDVDKVVGLELGADDYLTKPFNPRELVARVKAVLRRYQTGLKAGDVIEVGKLRIDLSRQETTVNGQLLKLRTKEFALLSTLAQNVGIVFSREKLLEVVWGFEYYGETRTVDVHVNHLREKIGGSGAGIETVRGTGYKLTVTEAK